MEFFKETTLPCEKAMVDKLLEILLDIVQKSCRSGKIYGQNTYFFIELSATISSDTGGPKRFMPSTTSTLSSICDS